MDPSETTSSCSTSQTDDGEDLPNDAVELQTKNDSLIAELESLRDSHRSLQSRSAETEEKLAVLQHQNDEALSRNTELLKTLEQVLEERENLRDELRNKIDEESKEKERIRTELDDSSERIRDLSDKIRVLLDQSETLKSAKECLVSIIESVDENRVEIVVDEDEELGEFSGEVRAISELARRAETKLSEYQEMRKKEKRELENSVVSLTEENRDINTLLRIALVEKEAVEKSLNKLKGNNNDQKRVALLQIAERGLQRVGFGFMMGAGANETASDNSGANMGNKSDGSECDEEVVSLASTVERIMKNLRLEITQLRRSLEESRSDTERLQSLTEKQSQKIAENALYIKELEDRETMLAQNVEELLIEIKETEEEIARWREACELEVEAGKIVVEERDKVVLILKQELEKTKAALDISNGKLKLKEELAAAAMAAQAAAERSLQLADSRTAGLNARIEELTRQLEEPESRERTRRKVRHICWPWRALKVNSATSTNSTVQKMIPEMQALLL